MNVLSKVPREHICPAGYGHAFSVEKGQLFRLTDLEGQQPIDFWAFNKEDPNEHLSVAHTRVANMSMVVRKGQSAYTNKRRAIVTLIEDNSPGQHDMLLAACDKTRFETLGHKGYHRNCQDNLHEALGAAGVTIPFSPQPWNLFTHFPWTSDMRVEMLSPDTKPGDNIVFRAEMDAVIAISACPQDIVRICGDKNTPVKVEVAI
ncbi:DUF1989 domain-containing protein [Taklimakanibacter deserti]|uniref:DUF1989 domain-containing protein n=1 Tax=Taklimakanibacter deserti TaxID=2267839 RepID=UPI000E64DB74